MKMVWYSKGFMKHEELCVYVNQMEKNLGNDFRIHSIIYTLSHNHNLVLFYETV